MSIDSLNLFTAIELNDLNEVSILLFKNIRNLNEYVNQRNINDKNTPLILAVQKKRFDIAKLLIYAGADVKKANEDGKTPLYFFVEDSDNYDLKNLLIECGTNFEVKNKQGNTSYHKHDMDKHQKDKKCDINSKAMFDLAITCNSSSTVRLAEKLGFNFYKNPEAIKSLRQFENGEDLLEQVITGKYTVTDEKSNGENEAKLLFEHCSNINLKKEGQRLLDLAIEHKKLGIIKLLKDHDVDLEAKVKIKVDYRNYYVSRLCKAIFENDIEKASILIKCGANVDANLIAMRYNPGIFTPLGYAIKNKNSEIIKLLLDHNATITPDNISSAGGYIEGLILLCYHQLKRKQKIFKDYLFKPENEIELLKKTNCKEVIPTVETSTKMISDDPTVKAAMEARNGTLTTGGFIVPYKNTQPTNSSYPEITGQSSNTSDTGTAEFIAILSILVLPILIFLGKKFCGYCRGRNSYSGENKRNAANQLLLEQEQNSPTGTKLSDAGVDTAENGQGVATTPL